jgi:hypothetical protein
VRTLFARRPSAASARCRASSTELPSLRTSRPAGTRRVALVVLIALASMNIWTGAPMLALWIGSRVQGGGSHATMGAIVVVTVVLAALCVALVRLVSILQHEYDKISPHSSIVRTHAPWLRSMRGERKLYTGEKPHLTAPERVLVIVAVLAVATFEVWFFFFFSGSPIDQRTGRGEVPTQLAQVDRRQVEPVALRP